MVEFAEGQVQGRGPVRAVAHGSDDNLYVEFYKNPVDGLDHIRMLIPGDKLFKPDFIADEKYQRRFPGQWQAYKSETDQFAGQTRLEEIAWVDAGSRDMMRAVGVRTVEQLAAVTDNNLGNLGHGARGFRDRARKEVETLSNAKAFEEARAEKEAMRAEIAELRAMMEELTAPKKPGRPRKEAANG